MILSLYSLGRPEEYRTAIDILPLQLGHCLGSRLGRKDAFVAIVLELWQEEVVELFRFDLLQTYDVRCVVPYLVDYRLFPVLPAEGLFFCNPLRPNLENGSIR